jgi:hypothetical protein
MVVVAEAGGGGLIAAAFLTVVAVVLMAEVGVVFNVEGWREGETQNAKRNSLVVVFIYIIFHFLFANRQLESAYSVLGTSICKRCKLVLQIYCKLFLSMVILIVNY